MGEDSRAFLLVSSHSLEYFVQFKPLDQMERHDILAPKLVLLFQHQTAEHVALRPQFVDLCHDYVEGQADDEQVEDDQAD